MPFDINPSLYLINFQRALPDNPQCLFTLDVFMIHPVHGLIPVTHQSHDTLR